MSDELLKNWEKKSADRQKLYKQYLQRANKKSVLKVLPDLHEEAITTLQAINFTKCFLMQIRQYF